MNSVATTDAGSTRRVPRIRDGTGAVTSFSSAVRPPFSHARELGPMARLSAVRASAERPRSVSDHRAARRPYSATLIAQWFVGSPPPFRRAHA